MKLDAKQKKLLVLTTISLLIIIILLAFFERNMWLSFLSFVPFIPFCLLTLTTNQKIFTVQKQWSYLLGAIIVVQLMIMKKAAEFILGYFGYSSKIYVYVFLIILYVPYFYMYRKNLRRNQPPTEQSKL